MIYRAALIIFLNISGKVAPSPSFGSAQAAPSQTVSPVQSAAETAIAEAGAIVVIPNIIAGAINSPAITFFRVKFIFIFSFRYLLSLLYNIIQKIASFLREAI